MGPYPFTFSVAERAEACPGSQALPQIPSTGIPGLKGAAIHRFVMLALNDGRELALAAPEFEPYRDIFAQYDLWGFPEADTFANEVAFAYDPETGAAREIGRDIKREYEKHGAHPHEIVGAADFIAIDKTRVYVDDLKTGYGAVTRAADNLQLLGLAVVAAKVYGRAIARVRLFVRREDGSGYFDDALLDRFELALAEQRLKAAARGVASARAAVADGRQPYLHEGPWCDHCPARSACPAKIALVKALAMAPRTVLGGVRGAMMDDDWIVAFDRLRLAKMELRFVEDEIVAFVKEHGAIDLGLDEEYGPREVSRPIVDGKIAHEAIVSYLVAKGLTLVAAVGAANKAVKMDASKASIRRALIPHAGAGQLSGMHREVLQEIADNGGIAHKVTIRVDRHPKKKGLLAPKAEVAADESAGEDAEDGEVL